MEVLFYEKVKETKKENLIKNKEIGKYLEGKVDSEEYKIVDIFMKIE